ncbi:MAG: hypothetical protein Tsb0016_17200 [Sphingomonadales bacterium]
MATHTSAGNSELGLHAVIAWHGRVGACRLTRVSAVGAQCHAVHMPPLGSGVMLRHGLAGKIAGTVVRHGVDDFIIAFARGPEAGLFAMKAAMLAMTTPPWPLEQAPRHAN